MRATWDKPPPSIVGKLQNIREASMRFNKETFGNIFRRKKRVEQRLQGVQQELDWRETEAMLRLEHELREEYEEILLQEELMWYQKSREQWVRFGDRNTNFFHTQTVIRRKRNKIHGMFIGNGVWSTDEEELEAEAHLFYTNLFYIDMQVVRNNIMDIRPPTISPMDQASLMQPV